jgi:hypothetical protein
LLLLLLFSKEQKQKQIPAILLLKGETKRDLLPLTTHRFPLNQAQMP